MADAARVLPVAGAILFFIPLLWKGGGEAGGAQTSFVMMYLFLIWVLLIIVAAILSRFLRADAMGEASDSDRDGVS